MRVSAARTVCYERHVNASVASFQIQRRAQLFVVGTGVVTVMSDEGRVRGGTFGNELKACAWSVERGVSRGGWWLVRSVVGPGSWRALMWSLNKGIDSISLYLYLYFSFSLFFAPHPPPPPSHSSPHTTPTDLPPSIISTIHHLFFFHLQQCSQHNAPNPFLAAHVAYWDRASSFQRHHANKLLPAFLLDLHQASSRYS
jgi:hypothetical protein